jgi:hypothetical protein
VAELVAATTVVLVLLLVALVVVTLNHNQRALLELQVKETKVAMVLL